MKVINKIAYRNYQILKELEAGISLTGSEAKSLRKGRVIMRGSFVKIKNNQMRIYNLNIPHFQINQPENVEETRTRNLLVTKKQLLDWSKQISTKGITIVPLSIITHKNLVKIKLGLAKGKREFEKRDVIKKRQFQREAGRIIRGKR